MKNKRILVFLLTVLLITCFANSVANASFRVHKVKGKSDWQIVKMLTKKYRKPIKLLDENKLSDEKFWKVVEHRRGKPYIVVTKHVSVSNGKGYGWYRTKDGGKYITAYNKLVPKGRKVVSYLIWNPKTNYCDDIIWVVDNKAYR